MIIYYFNSNCELKVTKTQVSILHTYSAKFNLKKKKK